MKLVRWIIIEFSWTFPIVISATGDDENTENEGASLTKKTKGRPGRKPAQKSKTTESKDNDQEIDQDIGKRKSSVVLFTYSFR